MGCGCKKGNQTPQPTPTATTTQTANRLDEQRVASIKNEIKNIVSKYYNSGKVKK